MNKIELIEEVKGRFSMLLHKEQDKLEALLKGALRTYQEKAGVIQTALISADQITEGMASVPADFGRLVKVEDLHGRWINTMLNNAGTHLVLNETHGAPYEVTYFIDLVAIPNDQALPVTCIGTVMDLFELQVKIKNTERLYQARQQQGLESNDLTPIADLEQQKTSLIESIGTRQGFIPPISVR